MGLLRGDPAPLAKVQESEGLRTEPLQKVLLISPRGLNPLGSLFTLLGLEHPFSTPDILGGMLQPYVGFLLLLILLTYTAVIRESLS